MEKYINRLLPDVQFAIPEMRDCQTVMFILDEKGNVKPECKNLIEILKGTFF